MQTENILTYYQYRTALTEFISQHGSADTELQDFISQNSLDTRFNITLFDVQKDALAIIKKRPPSLDQDEYKNALRSELLPRAVSGLGEVEIMRFIKSHRYQLCNGLSVVDVRMHLAQMVDGTWVPMNSTFSSAFQTYSDYRDALRDCVPSYSREPLTDLNIKVFIKRNGLDKKYGIDVATVRQDMYALPNLFGMFVLQVGSDFRQIMDSAASIQESGPSALANPDKQKSEFAKPEVALDSLDFYAVVSKAFLEYPEIMKDRKRLSGLLRDLSPKQKREINVFLQIFDLGIIEEIERQTEINHLFVHRFCKKLEEEYGTSEELAEQLVGVWCLCYGRDILHIKLNGL